MYLTPVVFPVPTGGWSLMIFQANPLTPLILTARDLLTDIPSADAGATFAVTTGMLVLLGLMWIVYRAAMPISIERMGA
jgi:lipopolysaccharide transport system permease protein